MPIPNHTPDPESSSMGTSPLQRLSKAVKELNRLIHRAEHLSDLAEQHLPQRENLNTAKKVTEVPVSSDTK